MNFSTVYTRRRGSGDAMKNRSEQRRMRLYSPPIDYSRMAQAMRQCPCVLRLRRSPNPPQTLACGAMDNTVSSSRKHLAYPSADVSGDKVLKIPSAEQRVHYHALLGELQFDNLTV